MINIGAFWNSIQFPAFRQSTISKLGFCRHFLIGSGIYYCFQLIKFSKFIPLVLISFQCAIQLQQSVMKKPLSGIPYTFAFLVFQYKQLVHSQVAIPPAETPVMTITSPLQKSCFQSINLNCSSTFRLPLKYNFLSLYSIGFQRCPTYQDPSQYITNTLVQSQNTGFYSLRGDNKPILLKLFCGLQFLVEPRLLELLLQQDYKVQDKEPAPQNPPLSKYIINLFLFAPLPSWMYKPGGEPSKHAAPLSWGCNTKEYKSYWHSS